jgi:hypothetical protein
MAESLAALGAFVGEIARTSGHSHMIWFHGPPMTMERQDPLGPIIDLLGAFIGSVGDPVTCAIVALLAVCMTRRSFHLLAAASVGLAHAASAGIADAPLLGLAASSALAMAGSLLQAWLLWPLAQLAKEVARFLRPRAVPCLLRLRMSRLRSPCRGLGGTAAKDRRLDEP